MVKGVIVEVITTIILLFNKFLWHNRTTHKTQITTIFNKKRNIIHEYNVNSLLQIS